MRQVIGMNRIKGIIIAILLITIICVPSAYGSNTKSDTKIYVIPGDVRGDIGKYFGDKVDEGVRSFELSADYFLCYTPFEIDQLGIQVSGQGRLTSIIILNNDCAFSVNAWDFQISNLCIHDNPGYTGDAIVINTGQHIRISNCFLGTESKEYGMFGTAININPQGGLHTSPRDIHIKDNCFINCSGDYVIYSGNSEGLKIESNTFSFWDGSVLYTEGNASNYISFQSNSCDTGNMGCYIDHPKVARFIGNNFSNMKGYALKGKPTRSVFTGNTFEGCSQEGESVVHFSDGYDLMFAINSFMAYPNKNTPDCNILLEQVLNSEFSPNVFGKNSAKIANIVGQ